MLFSDSLVLTMSNVVSFNGSGKDLPSLTEDCHFDVTFVLAKSTFLSKDVINTKIVMEIYLSSNKVEIYNLT